MITLFSNNQLRISQTRNTGFHSVKRAFRTNGKSVILLTGNLKLDGISQSINDCIVNSDRSRTVCKIRSVGVFNILAARGYMNYVLGRDTILILVNLNGEGQIIVFRGILRYSVSRSQNATSLGYGRQSIVDEIYILAVDIFTLDVGQGTNIFKGYIQGFVIKVQTLNALISHVTDIPSAAVVVPAFFIAFLGRSDIVTRRPRNQAICFFWICIDSDICINGCSCNIKRCLIIQIYIILHTGGFIVINNNITLYSCICGLADVHTGTMLISRVAGNLNLIIDMQTTIGFRLSVGIYASAQLSRIICNLSILIDVYQTTISYKDCTATCSSGVILKSNAVVNIQSAVIRSHCTRATLIVGNIVYATARYGQIRKTYCAVISHIDYTTIVGAAGTIQINIVEIDSRAVCYFDKTRFCTNTNRTRKLNSVCITIRGEIDCFGFVFKLELLRSFNVRL